jgi:hypothetical protein
MSVPPISAVLAASAPGIGDLVLFSPEWVALCREALQAQVQDSQGP